RGELLRRALVAELLERDGERGEDVVVVGIDGVRRAHRTRDGHGVAQLAMERRGADELSLRRVARERARGSFLQRGELATVPAILVERDEPSADRFARWTRREARFERALDACVVPLLPTQRRELEREIGRGVPLLGLEQSLHHVGAVRRFGAGLVEQALHREQKRAILRLPIEAAEVERARARRVLRFYERAEAQREHRDAC